MRFGLRTRVRPQLVVAALLSSLVAGGVQAQEKRGLVAVMPLEASAAPKVDRNTRVAIEEALRAAAGAGLTPLGYTVLNRDNTIRLLEDNDVDLEAVCNASCALAAAQEMKADLYVTASLAVVEGSYFLTLIVAENEKGRQLADGQLTARTILELRSKLRDDTAPIFARAPRIGAAPGAEFKVTFESTPPGAQVRVDNLVVCPSTPCEAGIPAGLRQIVMRKPGYEDAEEKMRVLEGTRLSLALTASIYNEEGQPFSWTRETVAERSTLLSWERFPPSEAMTWDKAEERCRRLQREGGGWRLPTRTELGGLVRGTNSPSIDPAAFPETEAAGYWTSSAEAGEALTVVDFSGGLVAKANPTERHRARCVRSGRPLPSRWTVSGASVRDGHGGRQWERVASAGALSRDDAVARCQTLQLDGDGWRLPSTDELRSLVQTEVRPAIDTDVFPGTPPEAFWSTDGGGTKVSFRDGSISSGSTGEANVRCVRTPTFAILAARGSPFAVRAGLGALTGVLGVGVEYRLFDLVLPGGWTRGFKVAAGTGTHLITSGISLGPTTTSGVYMDLHFVWSRVGLFGQALAPGYGFGATLGYDWRPVRGLSIKAGAGVAHNSANAVPRPLMFDLAVGPVF